MSTTKKDQPKTKLIDLLRDAENSGEEAFLTQYVKQAHINTQQEMLHLEMEISKQDSKIRQAMFADDFSATKLYTARKEKQLMELKLDGLKEILNELF